MAIEGRLKAYRREDFAFVWEHADQLDVSNYGLVFEVWATFEAAVPGATPTIRKTVGSGITLDPTDNYRVAVVVASTLLDIDAGHYVFTISRSTGERRVLTSGPFTLAEPRAGGA